MQLIMQMEENELFEVFYSIEEIEVFAFEDNRYILRSNWREVLV